MCFTNTFINVQTTWFKNKLLKIHVILLFTPKDNRICSVFYCSLMRAINSTDPVPRLKLQDIRINRVCGFGIEKSVQRITVWHHKACRVITNGDSEGQIFLSHPHTNDGVFFLLNIKYHTLCSNQKMAPRRS